MTKEVAVAVAVFFGACVRSEGAVRLLLAAAAMRMVLRSCSTQDSEAKIVSTLPQAVCRLGDHLCCFRLGHAVHLLSPGHVLSSACVVSILRRVDGKGGGESDCEAGSYQADEAHEKRSLGKTYLAVAGFEVLARECRTPRECVSYVTVVATTSSRMPQAQSR